MNRQNKTVCSVIVVAVFSLSACARTTWVRPGGVTEHQFNQDFYGCVQEALSNTSRDLMGNAVAIKLRDLCMAGRGYTKE